MAKKNMIQREIKRSKLAKKYYLKRLAIKDQLKEAGSFSDKMDLRQNSKEMPRNSAAVRGRNRCWLTGRSRGYYRDFGLSRHVFREMSHECLLPGVTKSSW
uniref:Small ribosomal subunit protein uS14c n=1 Tax=Pyropia yezoensis TaxID=2788 RepID=RR14_PYRYE|nr:ribosomal protein S14 [Neopyropia yezoensis]Q1XDG8.1 RecName: Full=Small ribosomal subunit protein uS14c; AltName: Full=30S ribosomal protein S14, chloroplastic [Neopyropia yezoensis]BAE92443.1 30S ribosomal protein S14 [Neopyropia yezoensis]